MSKSVEEYSIYSLFSSFFQFISFFQSSNNLTGVVFTTLNMIRLNKLD